MGTTLLLPGRSRRSHSQPAPSETWRGDVSHYCWTGVKVQLCHGLCQHCGWGWGPHYSFSEMKVPAPYLAFWHHPSGSMGCPVTVWWRWKSRFSAWPLDVFGHGCVEPVFCVLGLEDSRYCLNILCIPNLLLLGLFFFFCLHPLAFPGSQLLSLQI